MNVLPKPHSTDQVYPLVGSEVSVEKYVYSFINHTRTSILSKSYMLFSDISQVGGYNMIMRILVVEDDQKILGALKRGLERQSYAVDAIANGDEGLQMAMSEPYDLV